jgi:hypothetical protein
VFIIIESMRKQAERFIFASKIEKRQSSAERTIAIYDVF